MGKSNKLLIIDDNEEVLTSLYEYLSQKKYQVISASNGLDGLKLLDAEKGEFDLIITDLVMPNISGVGVISIVKKISDYSCYRNYRMGRTSRGIGNGSECGHRT